MRKFFNISLVALLALVPTSIGAQEDSEVRPATDEECLQVIQAYGVEGEEKDACARLQEAFEMAVFSREGNVKTVSRAPL